MVRPKSQWTLAFRDTQLIRKDEKFSQPELTTETAFSENNGKYPFRRENGNFA
jgi:hypothetical protein